jgi:hypothetical protein
MSKRAFFTNCIIVVLAPALLAQQRAADGVALNDDGVPQYSTF